MMLAMFGSFAIISLILYEKMMKYKNLLNRTRDDSKELEKMLEEKN